MFGDSNRNARRLSVAMIVRDAAALVPATLKSVKSIADEIVVADTGSTDDSCEVAARLATRTIDVPWRNSFADARNACLAETTGDWVLWLDAGETISENVASALREFVDGQAEPDRLYKLFVQLTPETGYFADQQIAQTRLVPRRRDLCFEGRVRERIVSATGDALPATELLHWVIRRHAGDQQSATRVRRAQRNLKLAELEIAERGPLPRLLLVRAEAFAQLGETDEARRWFVKARHDAEHGSDEMLESYYGELTSLDGDDGHQDVQLDLCIEALEMFPTDIQLLCAMGGYLQMNNRIELATRAYRTAVEYGKVNPHVWHLADVGEIAVVCLSMVYQLQDRHDKSLTLLRDALAHRPESRRLWHQLFESLVLQHRHDDAIAQLAALPPDMPHREAFANSVRGACRANERDWPGAEGYLEPAYQSGCRDPICLFWLAETWISLKKFADARALLDDWQTLEPGADEIEKFLSRIPVEIGDRQVRFDEADRSAAQPTGPIVPRPISSDRRRPTHS
jgi:tetratricopeptide (TPR) repeat protein